MSVFLRRLGAPFALLAIMQIAAAPALAAAPSAETPAEKPKGSAHVQCDGSPPGMSGAELAGRLLLITASGGIIGGIVGAPETADNGLRLKAKAGVAACDQALAAEKDPVRRTQLSLARAVHLVEDGDLAGALAAAKRAPGEGGQKTSERGFQQSLGVASLELQATIYARQGRAAEAQDAALRMADLSPYDVMIQQRAERFVGLTGDMSPGVRSFFGRYARLYTKGLADQARQQEWAGDFAGAAASLEAETQLYSYFADKPIVEFAPNMIAWIAMDLALAGDMERSNQLAAQAAASLDKLTANGQALQSPQMAADCQAYLDFQGIVRRLAEGKAAEARLLYGARPRWLPVNASLTSALAARLQAGAAPAELTGALAKPAAAQRAEGLAARMASVGGQSDDSDKRETADGKLYGAIRPYLGANEYRGMARRVWNTEKSPFILKRNAKDKLPGEVVFLYGVSPSILNPSMMLHLALVARARGKTAFVLSPARSKLDAAVVIFGSPGDPGLPALAAFDAEQVIADLSPEIPQPANK